MLYHNIFFKMPEVTGDTLFFLSNGNVYSLKDDLPPVKFGDEAIQLFFQTGLWVIQDDSTETECNACEETVQPSSNDDSPVPTEVGGAIKSDGGSSTYYDIELPDWLISRVFDRYREGRTYIKTEELIEVTFNSDFDAGNAFKSLIRLWGAFNGAGKAGNTVSYEKKKIEYSVDKLEKRFARQGEAQ
jgi:hypothetical protein